jgi:putative nucleotidyltransferase with HDIG domain
MIPGLRGSFKERQRDSVTMKGPQPHSSEMPKLERAGLRFVGLVVAAGGAALAHSIWTLIEAPPSPFWAIFVALTLVSGSATFAIPGAPISFSISDTFTIAAALLFGPAAGAVSAALDGLTITFRMPRGSRTVPRTLFNTTAPAAAMWLSATVFFLLTPSGTPSLGMQVLPLATFALMYFLLNTGTVARAVAYERRAGAFDIWREYFVALWPTYLGGTVMAGLLLTLVRAGRLDLTVVTVAVPLPLILYFTFKHAIGRVEDRLGHLAKINRLYLATIETLAHAIDAKDQVTHGHIRRVQRQAVRLARELGVSDEQQIRAIEAASLLHDTGKLAIPEHILNKPGRLTDAEFEIMKRHAPIGAEILSTIDFPYPVVPIVRHHHENWDGSGYPDGLRGEAIPIGARILSVVDCFDALTSDRPYRRRMPTQAALDILRERRGWMYDPRVVDTFIRLSADLVAFEEKEERAASREERLAAISGSMQAIAEADRRAPEADEDIRRLAAALDVGAALASPAGVEAALVVLLKSLAARASDAVMFRVDSAADALDVAAAAGQNRRELRALRMRIGEGVSGWVAANRQPMINADPRLDLQGRVTAGAEHTQSMIAAPIVSGAQMVGVLALYSPAVSAFSDADLHLISALAHAFADRLAAEPAH